MMNLKKISTGLLCGLIFLASGTNLEGTLEFDHYVAYKNNEKAKSELQEATDKLKLAEKNVEEVKKTSEEKVVATYSENQALLGEAAVGILEKILETAPEDVPKLLETAREAAEKNFYAVNPNLPRGRYVESNYKKQHHVINNIFMLLTKLLGKVNSEKAEAGKAQEEAVKTAESTSNKLKTAQAELAAFRQAKKKTAKAKKLEAEENKAVVYEKEVVVEEEIEVFTKTASTTAEVIEIAFGEEVKTVVDTTPTSTEIEAEIAAKRLRKGKYKIDDEGLVAALKELSKTNELARTTNNRAFSDASTELSVFIDDLEKASAEFIDNLEKSSDDLEKLKEKLYYLLVRINSVTVVNNLIFDSQRKEACSANNSKQTETLISLTESLTACIKEKAAQEKAILDKAILDKAAQEKFARNKKIVIGSVLIGAVGFGMVRAYNYLFNKPAKLAEDEAETEGMLFNEN